MFNALTAFVADVAAELALAAMALALLASARAALALELMAGIVAIGVARSVASWEDVMALDKVSKRNAISGAVSPSVPADPLNGPETPFALTALTQ